ncbi:MAG: hypothetical protein GX772_07555 [Alcaligenaceae bacterium]|nr:hypothetical protein [Alcaligenaceae bacterium]
MRRSPLAPFQGALDIQVAEYICGLLEPHERAQVHGLLSRDDQALAQALAWEAELLSLVDALPRVQPSAALRERLQATLKIGPPPAPQPPAPPQLLRQPSREPATAFSESVPAPPENTRSHVEAPSLPASSPYMGSQAETLLDLHKEARQAEQPASRPNGAPDAAERAGPASLVTTPTPSEPPVQVAEPVAETQLANNTETHVADRNQRKLLRKLWFWRLTGVCAACAAILGFMLPGEPPPPPVQVLKVAPTRAAILQAPGTSSTPGWTATLGPEGDLMMQPLVHTEVPSGSQTLLWTRSRQIPEPRLLGRIDPNQAVQVPAALLGALTDDQLLEITLETDDDAAKGQANGPILFIGQITMFGAEGAARPAASDNAANASPTSGLISH